jgi:hypothetical protein
MMTAELPESLLTQAVLSLEVAGRARGRLESWHTWSFPFSPLARRR